MRTSWRGASSCCATRSTRSRLPRLAPARTRSSRRSCAPPSTPRRSRGPPPGRSPRCERTTRPANALAVAERELAAAAQHDDRFGPLADRAAALAAEAAELARDAAAAADARRPRSRQPRGARRSGSACSTTCGASTATSLEAVIAFGEPPRPPSSSGSRTRRGSASGCAPRESERRAALEAAAGDADGRPPTPPRIGWRAPSTPSCRRWAFRPARSASTLELGRGRTLRRGSRHVHVRPEPRRAAAAAGRIASGGEASRAVAGPEGRAGGGRRDATARLRRGRCRRRRTKRRGGRASG